MSDQRILELSELSAGLLIKLEHKADIVIGLLTNIILNQEKLMSLETQVEADLAAIDAATNTISGNLGLLGAGLTTISGEIDAFITAAKAQDVPQALLDQADALKAKVDGVQTALAAQIPVLDAIAVKGTGNVVPVQPVAIPPTTVTPAPITDGSGGSADASGSGG